MTPPPIRVWRDPIDDKMVAVSAACYVVVRGHLWGTSVFLLIEAEKLRDGRGFDWRFAAEHHLKDHVARHHGGRLPHVGSLREVSAVRGWVGGDQPGHHP